MDVTIYKGMIGSLLYLSITRPNIMLSACLCARYQADPKESCLLVVKHIMRYLAGTSHLGLWCPKSNTCGLLGYLDVDFIGSRTDRKCTLGGVNFLANPQFLGNLKNKNNVALSIAEAKYIAIGSCYAQLLWMKQ